MATVLATPAALAAPSHHRSTVTSLRLGIAFQRTKTWQWQDVAGVPRTPTVHAERRTRSVPYLSWMKQLWKHRRLHAKRHATRLTLGGSRLRAWAYRHDPCLATLIGTYENATFDPTLNFGGGHGNVYVAYGVPQATPGTKLARYSYTATGHYAGEPTGASWRTNGWLQWKWAVNYAVGRYGSTCAALSYRRNTNSY